MQKKISGIVCDTDTATDIGFKHVGEFGQPDGFEERLFITEKGQHFIYGIGGPESPYTEPDIKLLTDEQADEWKDSTAN